MSQRLTVIVATNRPESYKKFKELWQDKLDLLPVFDDDITYKEIYEALRKDAWIIPHKSDAIASWGIYKAWKRGDEFILSMSDDCYPTDDDINQHILNFNIPVRVFKSTCKFRVRGVPYKRPDLEGVVVMSHGLWENIPDLDASSQLTLQKFPEVNNYEETKVMTGYWPMCNMNVAFKREIAPLMYFGLMGEGWPYDRFGDIWCGIVAQKIMKHLGLYAVSGHPFIHHDRASDPIRNLVKEAPGVEVNEYFWERVDEVQLTKTSVEDCYLELWDKIDLQGEYWKKRKEATKIWINLFQ
tara:strand:- start:5011 stop:5904 length:894 start_codon:yes stop_codon:yes gene_type:complete